MEIRELIPKHKDDLKVIEQLKKLPFEDIEPIISDLLQCLQDMNWPIASPITEVLEPFSDKLVPEILNILKTNDGLWKLHILSNLARKTTDLRLLEVIERIAKFPKWDEIEEEVNLEAIAILNGEYK